MHQMTVWKQCDDVKGVPHNHEPTENYHQNLQLPSALWWVSAHCLTVRPTTLLFWFTHIALVVSFFSYCRLKYSTWINVLSYFSPLIIILLLKTTRPLNLRCDNSSSSSSSNTLFYILFNMIISRTTPVHRGNTWPNQTALIFPSYLWTEPTVCAGVTLLSPL